MKQLTADRLRQVLSYDESTGEFTRKRFARKNKAEAGWIQDTGYRQIGIDGEKYYAHRLVWLYLYGEWPKHDIDHIDGNKLNNKLSNLRETTRSVNLQNVWVARKHNKSGYLGVSRNEGQNTFFARINIAGAVRHLGSFKSPEEAHQAYLDAKHQHHIGRSL